MIKFIINGLFCWERSSLLVIITETEKFVFKIVFRLVHSSPNILHWMLMHYHSHARRFRFRFRLIYLETTVGVKKFISRAYNCELMMWRRWFV